MSYLSEIKKSTYNLKSLKNLNNNQSRLNFLMHITEKNFGLQKIDLNTAFNFNNAIFNKGNPFFFLRKNYKKLFLDLLSKSFLSPNLLKFFHIAYWPTNHNTAWRTYYNYHGLERKQRMYYIKPKIKKLTYLFSLIFKKSFVTNLIYFKSSLHSKIKNKYFNKLKYFYNLNINKLKYHQHLEVDLTTQRKNKNYIITNILKKFTYFNTPKFILKKRNKKEFKSFFFLTFRQRSFLKNLITYYFPVLSLLIHDYNIHSLPMKTKKPRRV